MDFSIVPKKIDEVMKKSEHISAYYDIELGYDPGYIDAIIAGEFSPELEFLERFSKYFEVDIFYLFGLIEYVEVEF